MERMDRTLLIILFSLVLSAAFGQEGAIDPSFDQGTGANDRIFAIALQEDSKFLIGGDFMSYNGIQRLKIARINSNGSLDPSFNTSYGPNNTVHTLVLQPDGKILFGGRFEAFNSIARNRIARLSANGSLDISFDPGLGADSTILTMVLQPDGKILIGGDFTSYNGIVRNRIARLNSDGSLDPSFNPGPGPNKSVESMVLQSNGRIVVGGWFTTFNGVIRNRITRLNSDGSMDSDFDQGTGTNAPIWQLTLQPDEKILVGGFFTECDGTARNNIARLNNDGSLDTSFDPGTGASNTVWEMAPLSDGKIMIAGWFTSYNGTTRRRIARINYDGSLDTAFDPNQGASSAIDAMVVQPDGKILIGGWFLYYNQIECRMITRILADIATDMEEIAPSAMPWIVPNPVLTTLQIAGLNTSFRWVIMDVHGRQLLFGNQSGIEGQHIDVSSLAAGCYFLAAEDESVRRSIPFIKQ